MSMSGWRADSDERRCCSGMGGLSKRGYGFKREMVEDVGCGIEQVMNINRQPEGHYVKERNGVLIV